MPSIKKKVKIHTENTWNGSWHQIHLFGKDFLLMARIPSDSNVYPIQHIFHASGMRLTGSQMILNVACLFEKFFNMINTTFVHFKWFEKRVYLRQGWHLTRRVILYCRVFYLHVENVRLLMCQECREFPKNPWKLEK